MKTTSHSIELLETRIAPAGIITVEVKAGTLFLGTVPGQEGDEVATIIQTSEGGYQLNPGAGTIFRFNGQDIPGIFAFGNVTNGIVVKLGAGNDALTFDGTVFAQPATIDLGSGNNHLTLDDTIFADLRVTTLEGNDTVSFTGGKVGIGPFQASLGAGADAVEVLATTARFTGRVKVDAGADNDTFTLAPDTFVTALAGLEFLGGDGENTFTSGGATSDLTVVGALKVTGLGGKDMVVLDGDRTELGALKLTLGDGDNTLLSDVDFLTLASDFTWTSGKGIDGVQVNGNAVFIGRNVSAQLGAGAGNFRLQPNDVATATLDIQGSLTAKVAGDPVLASSIEIVPLAGLTVGGLATLTAGDGANTVSLSSTNTGIFLGKGAKLTTGEGAGSLDLSTNGSILSNGPISMIHKGDGGFIRHNAGGPDSFVNGALTMTGSATITSMIPGLNVGAVKIATAVEGLVTFGGSGTVERQVTKNLDIFVPSADGQVGGVNLDFVWVQGAAQIRAGAGNDSLDMDDTQVKGALTVDLGAGNDQFRFEQTTSSPSSFYKGPVLLSGGDGADTFLIAGNMAGQFIFFSKQLVVDGGDGMDTLTVGTNVSFNPDFPLEQKNIP